MHSTLVFILVRRVPRLVSLGSTPDDREVEIVSPDDGPSAASGIAPRGGWDRALVSLPGALQFRDVRRPNGIRAVGDKL
jgi:hypothetical protein